MPISNGLAPLATNPRLKTANCCFISKAAKTVCKLVLWSVQGVWSRNLAVASIGIGGMLACRQEFAVVTASLAILSAREPEDVGRSYRWAHTLIMLGLAWMLFAFFGYLRVFIANNAPRLYLEQFAGEKAPIGHTVETAFGFLVLGLGVWALFLIRALRCGNVAKAARRYAAHPQEALALVRGSPKDF